MPGQLVQERSGSVGFIPHRCKGRRGHVCSGKGEGTSEGEEKASGVVFGAFCVCYTAEAILALKRDLLGCAVSCVQPPLEDAVRDAGLCIPARWAYIIPIGIHTALASCRGHHLGAEETTTPLKGGAYGHERTHDRNPR